MGGNFLHKQRCQRVRDDADVEADVTTESSEKERTAYLECAGLCQPSAEATAQRVALLGAFTGFLNKRKS